MRKTWKQKEMWINDCLNPKQEMEMDRRMDGNRISASFLTNGL